MGQESVWYQISLSEAIGIAQSPVIHFSYTGSHAGPPLRRNYPANDSRFVLILDT